jgi:hypothetical protein
MKNQVEGTAALNEALTRSREDRAGAIRRPSLAALDPRE